MRKLITIIGIILIILGMILGFFLFKKDNIEDEEWLNSSGDELFEEFIFDDVSMNHWASKYILFVTQRGMMLNDNNKFNPDEIMNVRDFLKLAIRASMPKYNIDGKSDEELITFLKEQRIIDANFRNEDLDSSLTNYYLATILARCDLNIRNNSQKISDYIFIDLNEVNEIDMTLIEHSVAKGFVIIKNNNYFYPTKVLNRAEIAESIFLFLNS